MHFRSQILSLTLLLAITASLFAQDRVFQGGVWTDASSWNPADVPNSASENAIIDAGGSFTVSIPTLTIGNLTIGSNDAVEQQNSRDVTIAGSQVANDGEYRMLDAGSLTDLIVGGTQLTLTGSGTLLMSNSFNNRIQGDFATNELVNGVDHTISGAGQFGAGGLQITNDGLIEAIYGLLRVDPGAAGATNNGTMQANGGTLELRNGTFANNGTIRAINGSVVEIDAGATVAGGTLTTDGNVNSTVQIVGNTARLEAVTNQGRLDINNGIDPILKGTITNQGQVNQNDVGSLTDVRMDGDVHLTGSGTWTLSNSTNNRMLGLNGPSDTLIHGANHRLEGAGRIGANAMGIINRGIIDANWAGGRMTIDPSDADVDGSGSDVVNENELVASNGGLLRLQGGLFENTGATIKAVTDGTVELHNGARIVGGELVTDGSAGSRVAVIGNTVTLEDVTNRGRLDINNGQDPILKGTLTNEAEFNQNDAGSLTDVQLDGNVTINGDGTWAMSSSVNNRIFGLTGAEILTHETNHTIQGRGQIGANAMGLHNKGTIDATSADLTINPSDVDLGDDADVVNDGMLKATSGGRLTLIGGLFQNNTTIRAEDASTVRLSASAHLRDGNLTSTGSGEFEIHSNTVTLEDVTLTTGSRMKINNGQDPVLKGTFTNRGQVNQNDLGSLTDVTLDGDVTLAGNGTWTMSNSVNNRMLGKNGIETLTNAASHTIEGRGQIGGNTMGLVNNGLIDATSVELTVDPADVDLGGDADVVNNGQMRASGGGRLTLAGGLFQNNSTIRAENGSAVRLRSNAHIRNGDLASVGTGLFEIQSNTVTLEDLRLTSGSTLQINNGQDPVLRGTITNDGQVNQNDAGSLTDVRFDGDVTLAGQGTWTMSISGNNRMFGINGTPWFTNGDDHTIVGRGQIGVNSTRLRNNGTIIGNSGTLSINPADGASGETTLFNAGTIRADGATVSLLGTSQSSNTGMIEALAGGTVTGTHVFVEMGSTLAAGTYRAINGTIDIAPAGYQPAINNGHLEVLGTGDNDVLGVKSGAVHQNDQLVQNNGSILLDDGAALTVGGLGAGNPLVSTGQLLVGANSVLDASNRATTFNIPSDTTTAGLHVDGGSLRGSGQINGGVYMPAGVLSPGDADGEAGMLSIDGDFNMDNPAMLIEDAVTHIELGGYTRGTEYDSFEATGDFFGQGELRASLINGFLPNVGDEFVIATYTEDGNVNGNLWDFYTFNRVQFDVVDRSLGGADRETVLTVLDVRDIDFNTDTMVDCQDIDALVAEVVAGTNTAMFDLNFDGVVDRDDVDAWLTEAGALNLGTGQAYLPGDANLDGVVDVTDLNRWSTNKFTSTAAWCSGDFNVDGVIDVSDLNIWNSFKFQTSGIETFVSTDDLLAVTTAAVPEPASLTLFGIALMGLFARARRR